MKTKVTKDLENNALVIERTFNTTKEKLWPYYAEKEKFEAWWGPEGWETTTKEFNFTPGGRVHYDMKCVDENQGEWYGQSSWGLMQIETIDEPNKFTYIDNFSDEEGNVLQDMPGLKVVNELIEEDGKVTLKSTSYAGSVEELDKLLEMGVVEGYDGQLNKLDVIFAE